MIPTTPEHVARVVDGRLAGDGSSVLHSVSLDSRRLDGPSPLFVALRGDHADGHDFAHDAVGRGATAVLVEHDVEVAAPRIVVDDTRRALRALAADVRRRVDPLAVAVTGSVGKTTVKDLTAAGLGAERRVRASAGSQNNELGVPLTLLGLDEGTEVLVAEIGARHVGDVADLAGLVAPRIAVVTAVEAVHLEVFGSIEAVARAKGELVDALGPRGTAVLNVADPRVAAMGDRAPRVVAVAADDPTADVHARGVRLDRWARASATAVTPWGTVPLRLATPGLHQVTNALLALAVAGTLGVDPARAADAMTRATLSPWRGQMRDLAGVALVDDAYNANPRAMRAALDTLVAVQRDGRAVAVLGVMAEIGAGARAEHEEVGRYAARSGVDRLVVVGRDAAGIAAGAREAGLRAVDEVADPDGALGVLSGRLAPGDVVLVKASRSAGLEAVGRGLDELAAEGSWPAVAP